jgi:enoyl-CoA hydratase/carnithine racemase
MACDRFTAQQAERWGFVNHVYPDDQVLPEARKLASRLLSMDPLSLAMTKTACNALANLMVPHEASWSDRELMLLAYRQKAGREERGETRPAANRSSRKSAPVRAERS